MKRFMMTTAIAMLPLAAMAQTSAETGAFLAESDPMSIRASDFIGMRVYTTEAEVSTDAFEGVQTDWNDIGEINDVVMNRDGEIEAVLVDIGGFLGIGERQVAVDMDAIRFVSDSSTGDMEDDYFLVMTAAQADLENAPEYSWSQTAEDMGEEVEQTAADTADAVEDTAEAATSEVAEATDSMTQRMPIEREGYMAADRAELTTEMLTGAPVYDANDEWIGEISSLIVSDDGTLTEAVVDVGGFLGLGEKPVALSMDDIDILREDGGDDIRIYVPMTEEELEAMPRYES